VFHRGQTNVALPAGTVEVLGDRTGPLDALGGGSWDAVNDTSGNEPADVARSAAFLRPFAKRYVFVSTISVYGDIPTAGVREDAPALSSEFLDADDPATRYGARKAACERIVLDTYGDDGACVRSGLIVGPGDPTDRFTYWVERLARGGDVLFPGDPARPVQTLDVRDLATFLAVRASGPGSSVYNVVGAQITMAELLQRGAAALGSRVVGHWAPDAFLIEQGVGPWIEMPLWLPDEPSLYGASRVNADKAVEAGLARRPIEQTFVDTLAWCASLHRDRARAAGLAPAREAELLALIHAGGHDSARSRP
jgi:2'-hydroxyisoflavone reductase